MKVSRLILPSLVFAGLVVEGCKSTPPRELTAEEKRIVLVEASTMSTVALVGSRCRAGNMLGGAPPGSNWPSMAIATGANVVQIFPVSAGGFTAHHSAAGGTTKVNIPGLNARAWTCPSSERFLQLYRTMPGVAE